MANQITHAVLAEAAASDLFGTFDRASFFIGTVFPDIRYLKVIDREKTHIKNLTFSDVLGEKDSFLAGVKYHSLTDEVREAYMVGNEVYARLPSSPYLTQALKMYEDELLYAKVQDWSRVGDYLGQVLDKETAMGIPAGHIERWHTLVQDYFKEPPTDESREQFIMAIGFPKETADEMNALVRRMREDAYLGAVIIGMHDNWKSLITARKV
jgi:hypothetical protein